MGNPKNDSQIKADGGDPGNPDDPNKDLAQNNANDFGNYEPFALHLPFDDVNQF